jgi:hypothetical protein
MVPPEYASFFATMAAVGATLFGLIFVAVSITPESIAAASAPLERQVKAAAAYFALLNPFMISLFALVPQEELGVAVIILSSIGLLSTGAMTLALLQNADPKSVRFRGSIFILASFFLYGAETYLAVRILQSPTQSFLFFLLANLLIFISAFGIIRAWELIGIRQFRIRNWLSSIVSQRKSIPNPPPIRPTDKNKKERGGRRSGHP